MRGDRCCHRCRAVPGACALKRVCPCHMDSTQKPAPGSVQAHRALFAEAKAMSGVRRA